MAERANIVKLIEKHLDEAGKLALRLVEDEARKILKKHTHLDEFVMSMGDAFFTLKECDGSLGLDQQQYFKPILDLLEKFDKSLYITGVPRRFTAEGEKITNW